MPSLPLARPLLLAALLAGSARTQVQLLVDAAGGGAGLLAASDVAVDELGNAYVAGAESDNVLRVGVDGSVVELVGPEGDGFGNALDHPLSVAVDHAGAVYVAGWASNNVLRVAPDGSVLEVVDEFGDGGGGLLRGPLGLSVDAEGAVYVAGSLSDNVLRVDPDGDVRVVLDARGDGRGALLDGPSDTAVAPDGRLLVSAFVSRNAFAVTLAGGRVAGVTELLDPGGRGVRALRGPSSIAVDDAGEVFLADALGDAVLGVSRAGDVRVVLDGEGRRGFGGPQALDVDPLGGLVVAYRHVARVAEADAAAGSVLSSGVLRVDPYGEVLELVGVEGDGRGHELFPARSVAVGASGDVFVTGEGTHNAFRVTPGG